MGCVSVGNGHGLGLCSGIEAGGNLRSRVDLSLRECLFLSVKCGQASAQGFWKGGESADSSAHWAGASAASPGAFWEFLSAPGSEAELCARSRRRGDRVPGTWWRIRKAIPCTRGASFGLVLLWRPDSCVRQGPADPFGVQCPFLGLRAKGAQTARPAGAVCSGACGRQRLAENTCKEACVVTPKGGVATAGYRDRFPCSGGGSKGLIGATTRSALEVTTSTVGALGLLSLVLEDISLTLQSGGQRWPSRRPRPGSLNLSGLPHLDAQR